MSSTLDVASYPQAVARRRAAFVLRDAFAAEILSQAEVPTADVAYDDPPSHQAMPFARPPAPATWRERVANVFRQRRRRKILLASGLFDADWYLTQHEDVFRAGVDPLRHYLQHGSYEGRPPGPDFDARLYCARYPDVAASGIEPWLHHARHGCAEGRIAGRTLAAPFGSRTNRTTIGVTPNLLGQVEEVGADIVRGWIYDPRDPGASLELRFFIDDRLVGRSVANHFRQDLLDFGLGHGHYGFRQSIPKRLFFEGERLRIVARFGAEDILFRDMALSAPARGGDRRKRVVHLEISDLLHYLTKHRRASGIQRVQIGFLRGLIEQSRSEVDIACCARQTASSGFVEVPCRGLLAVLDKTIDPKLSDTACRKAVTDFRRCLSEPPRFARSDIVFTIGAPWALDHHDEAIHALKQKYGIFYFQILYDLVPIVLPEVVDANFIPSFTRATATLFAQADHVFPISAFSDRALRDAARALDLPSPRSSVVTMAVSVGAHREPGADDDAGAAREFDLLALKSDYILCVGTIEPRKNHIALFKAWRRMLATRDQVPKLVLVGRIGWYMEDFVRILKATDHLDGHVIIVSEGSDRLLAKLYRDCLFTVFPSLYEGWGLPITESFAHGKVCICSSTTAMPEAGGDLALYVDPDDIPDLTAQIMRLVDDVAFRNYREAMIRTSFLPPSWDDASSDLQTKLIDAIRGCDEAASAKMPRHAAILTLKEVYRVARLGGTSTAKEHLRQSAGEATVAQILEGPDWYDLERDRCWSCGREARLGFVVGVDRQAPLAALIEVCFPEVYKGARCHVVVDGEERGSFRVETVHAAVRLPLAAPGKTGLKSRARGHSVVFSLDVSRLPDRTSTDNRALGTGVMSIFLCEDHDEPAIASWRAASRGVEMMSLDPVELYRARRRAAPKSAMALFYSLIWAVWQKTIHPWRVASSG